MCRDERQCLTAFLYGPLKCLCQLSVTNLIWAGIFTAFSPVCQSGTFWQLCFRQEASFGACGADEKHALLQVN